MSTILVVGASGGVGRSCVDRLTEQGHAVVAAVRHPERSAFSPGVTVVELDLADASPSGLDGLPHLDAVINAAATYEPSAATSLNTAQWDATMLPNLRGPLLVTSAIARRMMERGGGRIVHVTSITGLVSRGSYTMYEASKAGLVAAARSMAVELAPHGVLVNTVAPGWIRTAMAAEFLDQADPAAVAELIPLGRAAEPDEIAQVCCWLALESPAALTGQTIVVDGGQTAHTSHL